MEDTFDLLLSLVGKNPLTILGVIFVAVKVLGLIILEEKGASLHEK